MTEEQDPGICFCLDRLLVFVSRFRFSVMMINKITDARKLALLLVAQNLLIPSLHGFRVLVWATTFTNEVFHLTCSALVFCTDICVVQLCFAKN